MKPVGIIELACAFVFFLIIYENNKVLARKNKNQFKQLSKLENRFKFIQKTKKFNDEVNYKLRNEEYMDEIISQNELRKSIKLQLSPQLAAAKKKCWDMRYTEHYIINGTKTKRCSLPWMVSIYLQPNKNANQSYHICGGAIISTKFVLTAAHCLQLRYLPKQYSVRYGMQDTSKPYLVQQILKILYHPKFYNPDPERFYSDIGLIKLKGTIKYTNVINPICIPYLTTPTKWNRLRKGKDVLISGWGHTVTNANGTSEVAKHLQKGNAYIANPSECKESLTFQYDQSTTLCLGRQPSTSQLCSGDSGGPVIPLVFASKKHSFVFPVVIGIVSFGDRNCLGLDVLTKVESYIDWINKWTFKL